MFYWRVLSSFFVIFIADQVTKILAVRHLVEGVPIDVAPGFFNLTLVYNPGAAFGLFSNLPDTVRRTLLSGFSFVALIVLIHFLLKEAREDKSSQVLVGCILGGAIGNIVDRIRLDRVVDFLDFYWQDYHWPAFNIADSAISVGVFLLIIRLIFSSSKDAQNRKVS